MKCSPLIITSADGKPEFLERVESKSKDIKSESWLQNLIFYNPGLLPVQDFDERLIPLIPLGREIAVSTGNIDVLYVSPFGKLTIVETKLWKNPEQNRTVVAQIIDYAKEVSKWNYDTLEKQILIAARSQNLTKVTSLEELVKPYLMESSFSLPDFQERLTTNLIEGEFLLLIVGDKLSPNLSLLSGAVKGAPGLNFTIGLVELQFHKLEKDKEWPLLIIPDIVGKTIEEVRGVVKVQYLQDKPKVEIEEIENKDKDSASRKGRTTQDIFLSKISSDFHSVFSKWFNSWSNRQKENRNILLYWGIVGFSLRLKIGGKLQTILDAYPETGVSLIRENEVARLGADDELYRNYREQVCAFPEVQNILTLERKYVKFESLIADKLDIILRATNDLALSLVDK